MKIVLYICLLFSSLLHANVIEVGPNKPIKSIKKAIALAKAGDTVMVHKGLYKEGNIIINKRIVFLGKNVPVLDGQKKYEVLSIKADSVVVSGFKVIKSGYATLEDPCGIKVYNRNYVVIQNNVLDDNFFGIYIQNGSHCIIKNNRLTAYGKEEQSIGNGIHCWKSDSLQIIGNTISGHRDGIYFEFVTNSVIWRNISTRNVRYGLHFMFSNDDAYISNIFKNNGAGVAVMFTKNVKMFNNFFEENWGDAAYGLFLKEISDSYIIGNKFSKNTSGIHMEGTNRIQVEKNVFEANGWGMKILASCSDNIIKNNNFLGNTFDISTNGSLVLNTFNNNYWDKYEGYDLDKNGVGDVPFHPLSLFAVLTERNPSAMLLFRSFMITLLDKSERILPSITPDNFVDNSPLMHSLPL
ncbi:nitrous oxide reductase family maturation protein NosD [Flavobacterium rhamnosiphilum]|uniref:Nitrous oxide reductase family maturation protein NosD n=1 Tax=Flavobacterium rhamnosiphilum TaxID=2541724 RepID=A0A4R5F9S3_9FLAO|nr:nitrous oxide reductase family maturation protein NosD [Flavobacterium rhamnosiphilum]TDE44829.1 nitrous oxide reductase family maturation protein NosD [Flavobacterium rhamnosiphilum]